MMIARSMEATVIVDYRKLFRTGCWPNVLSEIVAQFNYPRPLCSDSLLYECGYGRCLLWSRLQVCVQQYVRSV